MITYNDSKPVPCFKGVVKWLKILYLGRLKHRCRYRYRAEIDVDLIEIDVDVRDTITQYTQIFY